MSISPLVALPGLTPGLRGARVLDTALGDDLPTAVLTVDGPDLIESAAARTGQSPLTLLVEAIAATADHAGFERFTIFAESYTATAALGFAAMHPERVDELVLAAPLGYSSPLTAGHRRPAKLGSAVRSLYSAVHSETADALGLLVGGAADATGLAAAYAAETNDRVRAAAATLADWLDSGAFDLAARPSGDDVRRVKAQTTLLWGRDDLYCGLDSGFYLTRRLRNVRLRVFPNTGHLLTVERPSEVGRHTRSVLGLGLPVSDVLSIEQAVGAQV